jgi:single-stranded-DNA-specific exonuclease
MEWRIHQQDRQRVAALAEAIGVKPLLAWILLNRGISLPDAARDFLSPSLEHLRPPSPMADTDRAVQRLILALDRRETIGIHGDYDVDGITGAALLFRFLTALGAACVWHLPHRQREGYGMKPLGVDALRRRGATLILAVDCGVSDFEAIDRAGVVGADVIVIDHHQVPERLPAAVAVLNAQREDCPFHGQALSGVGTAFYLLVALRARLRELGRIEDKNHNLLSYLDLVALGTVADVVPLLGLNRALVLFGLEQMNRGLRPGIVQLKRVADLGDQPLTAEHLSFQLAPRLNAAGRLDSGEPSLRLLLTDDEREAGILAEELEQQNQTRRKVEERILAEALRQIEDDPRRAEQPIVIVDGAGWHIGVIGIVASRLAETFFRPALVVGVHHGVGKGSLRSVAGVNIFAAVRNCADLLEAYGGHPMAAGLTVRAEKLDSLRAALVREVGEAFTEPGRGPTMAVDAEWPLSRCDLALVDELARLKPHGIGNPEPRLCARGVVVRWAREGRSNSLQLGLQEGGMTVTAYGFRLGTPPQPGDRLDVVYTPARDRYQGADSLRVRIRGLKPI